MDITLYHRAKDIPQSEWDQVLGSGSITFGRTYWEVIESSGMEEFSRIRYLLVRDEQGQAVAIGTYYFIHTDIAIFGSPFLSGCLRAVRRRFPNFLKLRMLECGSAININPPLLVAPSADREQVVSAVSRHLFNAARQEGAWLLVVRDFTPDESRLQQAFVGQGFVTVPGLPNAWLEVAWSSAEEYLGSMRSYYRSKLKKHLKRNREAGIETRVIEDFAPLAETLSEQWMTVHRQADEYQREVLTPAFYRAFSDRLGASSRILAFYREDRLIGHALVLLDGDTLRWMYFGRNIARNDSLYILVAYKVIELAIEQGARHIEQGLTTYSRLLDVSSGIRPVTCAGLPGKSAMRNRNGRQPDTASWAGYRGPLETGGPAIGYRQATA